MNVSRLVINAATSKKKMDEIARILKRGGIGVMPTDTIYGILGSALNRKTVEKIYRLRKRNKNKPMIVLIGSLKDLKIFGVKIDVKTSELFQKSWPGKISIILPIADKRFKKKFLYLHRGSNGLAFRLPAKKRLRFFLNKTGPLVAPSANLAGEPPSRTIREARKYFGDKVDFYLDGGRLCSRPSTLIKTENNKLIILRNGFAKLEKKLI